MGQIISLKINMSEVDKTRLYKGAKGDYLDAILYINDENDQYGNCGMITQQVSKEERMAKVKGKILGNGKILSGPGKPRPKMQSEPSHIGKVYKDIPEPPF